MGDYDNILVSRVVFPPCRVLMYDPGKSSDASRTLKFQDQGRADEVLSTPGEKRVVECALDIPHRPPRGE